MEEAERRGLLNYASSVEAMTHITDEKNVELFRRQGVFTGEELASRREIMLENYAKILHIEALTMLDMARREILPAMVSYADALAPVGAAQARAEPALRPTRPGFWKSSPG